MDVSPGFSRRGTGLFILMPSCSSCACSSWRGWQYRTTEGPSWWTTLTSNCSMVWGVVGTATINTPVIAGVIGVNVLQLLHKIPSALWTSWYSSRVVSP